MCYAVELEIVLQNDIPSRRSALELPKPVDWLRYYGEFPQYGLSGIQCACDLVGPFGHSTVHVPAVIEGLLRQQDVKRVRIKWHYIGESHDSTTEVRMSLDEFNRRNADEDLQQNTWYRINDPRKYEHIAG